MIAYTVLWLTASGLGLAACVRWRGDLSMFSRDYARFLFARWKLATFAVAAVGMVWLGPQSGDPTWDAYDATLMCTLTYFTAPWAVGVLARSVRGRAGPRQVAVALWVWLLSASWSYDLYMLLRTGSYSPAWLANLGASSVLYTLAGLLWNLDGRPDRGTTLAFLHDPWPAPCEARTARRTLLAAIPVMLVVAALMLGFFLHVR
jgi:hypothetical protein